MAAFIPSPRFAEAAAYAASFGPRAYEQCRTDGRTAMLNGDHKRARFLGYLLSALAKKFKRELRLDTATRYLEEQAPYDHGPGYVPHRHKDSTLH